MLRWSPSTTRLLVRARCFRGCKAS
jgi:hypothetical protein